MRSGAALVAVAVEQARGQGTATVHAQWAAAVLDTGLARYEEAESAARQAPPDALDPCTFTWALPELVEAAARGAHGELARDALVAAGDGRILRQ